MLRARADGVEIDLPAAPRSATDAVARVHRHRSNAPGLAALALALLSGCPDPRELPITVVLPAETSDLERADNASIVMRPSGQTFTFDVDGLDFALELEGEPTTEVQQLELYLAEGDTLLAWGTTPGVVTASADVGLALFLGRPGQLSTWPETIETPDPDLLATEAEGRGMLLLEADGDSFLLNHFTLTLEAGATLPGADDLPHADGGLFSAPDGSVVRLAWETVEPAAWRYDPSADAWTQLGLDAAAIDFRPGASTLLDPDGSRVYVLGGGDRTDAIAIDLQVDPDGNLSVAPVLDFALDDPRGRGAALWIPTADDPTADALIVGGGSGGGTDPVPTAVLASSGETIGDPATPWLDLACTILRGPAMPAGMAAHASDTTVLCVGGLDGDGESARAATVVLGSDGSTAVELTESFLPVTMPDPRLLSDDFAVYAQGEGLWLRVDRATGELGEQSSPALRARGGHSVSLATGATFLVGGVDTDGATLDRWQVFMPALEP